MMALRYLFLALTSLILAEIAQAGYPSIWGSPYSIDLQAGLCLTNSGACVVSGSADPSSSATYGTVGSIYLDTANAKLYVKQDGGTTTNWTGISSISQGSAVPPADFAASGTTTVNGSSSVVGSSTLFTTELAVGDMIAVSSATTTYASVISITDDTHLTASAALGNGTSQTISVKKYMYRAYDANGAVQYVVNGRGQAVVGPFAANSTLTAGAAGAFGVISPIATNTITSAQANSDSRLILRRLNATVSAIGQGTGNVISSPTKVVNTNVIGAIGFQGFNAGTTAFQANSARIYATAVEDFNDTTHLGTSLAFQTTPAASGTAADALTLGSDQSATFGGQIVNTHMTTGTNADFLCLKADGTFLIQASACTISSKRFKENIATLPDMGLSELMKLRPVEFKMKEDKKHKNADINFARMQIGLIAEDVETVDKRLALYESDGKTPKSYRQESIISLLVKAVQEQQHEIDHLKSLVKQ